MLRVQRRLLRRINSAARTYALRKAKHARFEDLEMPGAFYPIDARACSSLQGLRRGETTHTRLLSYASIARACICTRTPAEVTCDEVRSHGPPEATSMTKNDDDDEEGLARSFHYARERSALRGRSNLTAALRLIRLNDRESTNRPNGSINPLIPSMVTGHA